MLKKINRRLLSLILNSFSLVFNFLCFVMITEWKMYLSHLILCVVNVVFIFAEKNHYFEKVLKK